jgi:multicomponent Na+:H+ antiporter subunit C
MIFTAGRIAREKPPIVGADTIYPDPGAASALPQALILTAIVISFSFFAFLLVLVYRAYQEIGTDNTDDMRIAEPKNEPAPPVGY